MKVVVKVLSDYGHFAVVKTTDVAAAVFVVVAGYAFESALAEKQELALWMLYMLSLVTTQCLVGKTHGLVPVKEMHLESQHSLEKRNPNNLWFQYMVQFPLALPGLLGYQLPKYSPALIQGDQV